MDTIIAYLERIDPVWAALIATTFTWLVTAAGASFVFLFKTMHRRPAGRHARLHRRGDGGRQLLEPAGPKHRHERGPLRAQLVPRRGGLPGRGLLPLCAGQGAAPPAHQLRSLAKEGVPTKWHRTTLLVLAITLHNIPEGLAVGVLFGGVAAGIPEATIGGAVALAIGIGLQNFPEGVAVSMPLRRMGLSRRRSFFYGQLSAIVEPVAGVIGAVAVVFMTPILPYALAFAAGAMIYVVVEEVIPETQQSGHSDVPILGFIGGFVVMMVLDVALG
jgi:zinc transporter, ZIP family